MSITKTLHMGRVVDEQVDESSGNDETDTMMSSQMERLASFLLRKTERLLAERHFDSLVEAADRRRENLSLLERLLHVKRHHYLEDSFLSWRMLVDSRHGSEGGGGKLEVNDQLVPQEVFFTEILQSWQLESNSQAIRQEFAQEIKDWQSRLEQEGAGDNYSSIMKLRALGDLLLKLWNAEKEGQFPHIKEEMAVNFGPPAPPPLLIRSQVLIYDDNLVGM
ncbi:hypothetical protein GUITHDRAFT_117572 [Guillardia theta CCMP2712]|uniref:Uncharacterized protein n=1 Tax=Guillardia theta (strain CCMP2712) TaxID=905079 RepID=L1IIZ7_GUITC|nr:hypothetical protein GUITHDRAFT_117572 [Guillardia theta CCMP2712]EKX36216.1 hypothetical protein GUITHDRAFT_117572 [Guillardia theta CCMP2712]|eukprot:XP_005823196.1 hypothetical protein GUITHDRAFT_117572 [Guillardia theta CCMP2712]